MVTSVVDAASVVTEIPSREGEGVEGVEVEEEDVEVEDDIASVMNVVLVASSSLRSVVIISAREKLYSVKKAD